MGGSHLPESLSGPCRCQRYQLKSTKVPKYGAWFGLGSAMPLGLGLDSLSHSSSHALSFFSPPSVHTLSQLCNSSCSNKYTHRTGMCMYKPVHVSVRAVEAGILGWVTGLLQRAPKGCHRALYRRADDGRQLIEKLLRSLSFFRTDQFPAWTAIRAAANVQIRLRTVARCSPTTGPSSLRCTRAHVQAK